MDYDYTYILPEDLTRETLCFVKCSKCAFKVSNTNASLLYKICDKNGWVSNGSAIYCGNCCKELGIKQEK